MERRRARGPGGPPGGCGPGGRCPTEQHTQRHQLRPARDAGRSRPAAGFGKAIAPSNCPTRMILTWFRKVKRTDCRKKRGVRMSVYNLGNVTPELPNDDEYWIAPNAVGDGPSDSEEERRRSGWARRCAATTIRSPSARTPTSRTARVLHTDTGSPLTIGANVTVGHMVMLHGCTIGDNIAGRHRLDHPERGEDREELPDRRQLPDHRGQGDSRTTPW